MDKSDTRNLSLSSCAYVGLVLIFTRTIGSYTHLNLDFQTPMIFTMMLAWIALMFLEGVWERFRNAFFAGSTALVLCALALQQAVILIGADGSLAGASQGELLTVSSVLFAVGSAVYLNLWISAWEKKEPDRALAYIALASGWSAVVACLPPLLFGTDYVGSIVGFFIRIGMVSVSFVCLKIELAKPQEYVPDEALSSSLRDVLRSLGIVILAVLIARFTQGLVSIDPGNYRSQGAQLLLIASPPISVIIAFLAYKYGKSSGFISSFYLFIVIFSSVLLLVSAVVSGTGSPVESLWILQFASYAQYEIALLGALCSLRKSFGSGYYKFRCAVMASLQVAFGVGFLLHKTVATPFGNMICSILLISFLVFAAAVMLYRAMRDTSAQSSTKNVFDEIGRSLSERYGLSARELEVCVLLLQGRSYANISRKLFISEHTVKTHAHHIFTKMDVASRDEMIERIIPFD